VIVAEWKPIDEIMDKLADHNKVLLVGCATCVAECAAGGEREVEMLASLLRMGLRVQGRSVRIREKTLERQCEWEFVEELAEMVPTVDAIVSLACGIGVQALAERFSEVPVYPGVNTTALSMREEPGLWTERCAACGNCILDATFGLCPVARCAKGLLNGPCGGTRNDGKCEVDENTDCVWQLIVERAKERGRLDSLVAIQGPQDWSNSHYGGQRRMLREDLRQ